jgi:putative ABC transport system substrate-binding protein
MIIGLAARHKLPAVYPYRFFAADGGQIAYGPDTIEPYRRGAGYVDRILKGEDRAPGDVAASGARHSTRRLHPRPDRT